MKALSASEHFLHWTDGPGRVRHHFDGSYAGLSGKEVEGCPMRRRASLALPLVEAGHVKDRAAIEAKPMVIEARRK
jgi:hypothetical protein